MITLNIVNKLRLLTGLSLAILASVAGYLCYSQYQSSYELRKIATRQSVETAHGILDWAQKQEAAGTQTRAQAQAMAMKAIGVLRYSGSEYFWINDFEPRMVMHPFKPEMNGQALGGFKDPEGNPLFVRFVDVVRQSGAGYWSYLWPKPGQDKPVEKVSYVKGFEPWGWVIGSGVYMDDLRADFLAKMRVVAVVVLGALLVTFLVGKSIYASIDSGLKHAVRVARAIAAGDISHRVEVTSKDEIGELLTAMDTMTVNLNLTMKEVLEAAEELAVSSREIAAGSQELSSRTEQAAASLQQTAANMSHVTDAMHEASKASREAEQQVNAATSYASEEGEVFNRVVATMNEISGASNKISEITGVIDAIAFQTNILALNAAVEAARAGEQGRGFAVVASEVRVLAQRSATAAREIKDLIATSVTRIEAGAALTVSAGKTLERIVSSVHEVDGFIRSMSAATHEQAGGLDDVNVAVTALDQTTQRNAALVEETAGAAEGLREQAQRLAVAVGRFKLAA